MPEVGNRATTENISLELTHLSYIFPEDSNETATFTAGNVANTFGAWAEIVDNNAVSLSSKFTVQEGHLSAILIESADTKDKVYILEITSGSAKTPVAVHRFVAGDLVKLPTIQQIRVRPAPIPINETVYYRMKCETANAVCTLSFRYHYH
jgi:hypothetical protein